MFDIKKMLEEKIDEVILAHLDENGFQYGDIEPFDAFALDKAIETIADIIPRIGS